MYEITLALTVILGATTVGAAIQYYLRLRRVQVEYQRASQVISDIVVSVKKEFQNQNTRLDALSLKLQSLSLRGSDPSTKTIRIEKTLSSMVVEIQRTENELQRLLTKLDDVNSRIRNNSTSQQLLDDRVTQLEEKSKHPLLQPEPTIGAVIPIKREKALSPLTETELSVLDMLANEGPKTAPSIKVKLRLSREHTARLMKKLYEAGYLERETKKIPFEYRIKSEMKKFLKKSESVV